MSVDRLQRINELLKREIGDMLFRIIREDEFDVSAVTVTHVVTAKDLSCARVLVSIRDHHPERQRILALLRHHRAEIQKRINADLVLKRTPKLCFELDTSIEEGDRILALLSRMAPEEAPAPAGRQEPESP